MYAVKFDPKAEKDIAKWKKSNPILFKKLKRVLGDIMEHPRTGSGQPLLQNQISYKFVIYK